MASRKRKRERAAAMHPQNKYADNPPDFSHLASLYPSFGQYVSFSLHGRARIDWTDFNATRELTRVLLFHDFGIQWWIPDGQLCPTVPNRANYIHWINDLLSLFPSPWRNAADGIRGLDIGTGANCIYPLLGAAVHGWNFVGTDVTNVALEWAEWNVQQNPHLFNLISIRNVRSVKLSEKKQKDDELPTANGMNTEAHVSKSYVKDIPEEDKNIPSTPYEHGTIVDGCNVESSSVMNGNSGDYDHSTLPVLVGVVNEKEKFDFCMCNPPFFESLEEAGANPRTSCGGTSEEMVYPGGERNFILKIIEDSTVLKDQIHWFTTMVGRKVNLKLLISELWKRGVKLLRTTEFVQGRTCRWGLAWTYNFVEENCRSKCTNITNASNLAFVLEGIPRQCKSYNVLEVMVYGTRAFQVICEADSSTFSVKGVFQEQSDADPFPSSMSDPHFVISVFEQAPGSLLIKGVLLREQNELAGKFSTLFDSIKQILMERFRMKPNL